jgi:hypothetical protein
MQNTAMNRPVDTDSVRLKAYELWVSGGRRNDVSVQNWLEAEQILRSTEATISTYTVSASAPQVASVEVVSTQRVQATPPSTPPLGLTDLSATNKTSQKTPGKGGAGRKR